MSDSSKLIISPMLNPTDDMIETSISVADILPTICATAPVSSPYILSPNIDAVSKDKPDGNWNLSNVGESVLSDSYTPTILTASGTFNEISLSSTRNP